MAVDISKDTQFIELYVQYLYSSKIFPEGREQFTFSYDNGEAILFGGLITNKSTKLWKFNPEKYYWSIIDYENSNTSTSSIGNRSGHIAILLQKKLYVFGGKSKIHSQFVLQDLEIFDMETNIWTFPNFLSKNYLKLRKNHVAVAVGKRINLIYLISFFLQERKFLFMEESLKKMNIYMIVIY